VQRASDIHIEPGVNGGAVRFRIDGMMRLHMQLPSTVLARVVSRIKVMSKLNIADRLRPQDGRARIQVDGRAYDLRVSTVPTREAEKAVIRILRPMTEATLDAVKLSPREVERLRELLAHRDGIVAITGPTGSGKTTTIYAAVREIAAGEVNVVTVEDPVEYEVAGITQIQVDTKRGVTFASALRSILRQDPDVIFVGEIRDLETARIAVQAAMTGHLVIATVHANDAVGAIARFRDLGIDLASLASTLRGAVAQRLLRKLCDECAVPATEPLTEDESRLAATHGIAPTRRAVGCPACGNTGYRGRIPVAEVAVFTPAISELIASGASVQAIQRAAVADGMRRLHDDAAVHVASGDTTLSEVDRVLGAYETGAEPAAEDIAASGPSVLVVDEDPLQRELARTFLEASGYKVTDAINGREAVTLLNAHGPFSLVVTDLQMEEMDGVELLRTIRSTIDPLLPVIVLTGSDNATVTEAELLDAGADDYLRKPIDPARFTARVKAALRRRGVLEQTDA
jgi:type II secretory ATPase GspE/PulE/Tfp pilus assembly ATPase PilB-like protein/CheY-like chemotaxis protein